ncbi:MULTISPECIES: 2-keto-4-pentenoate hydratase [unclassified Inquilinus]|uniref:2-keto-4-pentenoate hydratase n=1 Tax=unclassified Inquilinus TaxID=2645927 RepID=UPI003F914C9C
MRKAMQWALALAALMGTMPAVAAEDCAATAARLADAWRAKAPVTGLSGIDAATAACVQKTLVQDLAADAGQPVGYKVGLTSQAMQERLGVGHPVSGVLLGGMLREPITPIPADFAARPMVEADLVAVIGDDGVNQAKTPEEVLAHLAALQPFIELSDLVLAPTEKPTAEAITAINVGARLGVLGPAIPIEPSLADRLATMKVSLTDETGKVLTEAPGSAVLGNPLNAVIWLAQDLAARGEALQPGQRVSLGSFGAPTGPTRGGVVTLRYDGLLLAPVTLVVRFE